MTDTVSFWEPINLKFHEFSFKERRFGYTISMWIKNEGVGVYSQNPHAGRDSTHLIKLEDTFAIWFDSQNSIRAYIYASGDYFETYTDPIFLPKNQWVNLQFRLNNEGVTMMTFNQQREPLQTVAKLLYMAE